MSASLMMRVYALAAAAVLLGLTAAPVAADGNARGGDATAAPAAVPVPPIVAQPRALPELHADAVPPGSVEWRTLAGPPAHREDAGAGDLMLQSGGGGAPRLRYYGLDALGSVRVVFDAAGNVVSRADYEPFGSPVLGSTTGTLPRQQFTGQERDGEVGVDYFGARMYVPQHGRMPSVDPLYFGAVEEPQRWNRYAYALNNPASVTDPDGRTAQCNQVLGDGSVGHCSGPKVVSPSTGTHPAFVQEHSADLFLLMQYGSFGYGAGGAGGGGVNMGEWDPITQSPIPFKPAAEQTVISGQIFGIEGKTAAELTLEVLPIPLGSAVAKGGVTAARVAIRGGESAATQAGRLAHASLAQAAKAKGWISERLVPGLNGQSYRPDIITPRGWIIELKPFTPSGIARGIKQAQTYAEQLGTKVRIVYYKP